MSRPRILDLFCGAGGCSVGYHRAGFDVVGVDLEPQPNYPYEFVQADALDILSEYAAGAWCGYDAIHASPPCPAYSRASHYHGTQANHPDLYAPVKTLLGAIDLPYVIENVEGSPLRRDVVLCGEMFGLRVHRHRVFETDGFFVMQPRHAPHRLKGAKHNCHIEPGHARLVAGNYAGHEDAADAMGIDWPMSRRELANAIPPAYSHLIGTQLLDWLRSGASARHDSSHARRFDSAASPGRKTGCRLSTDAPADSASSERWNPAA